LLRAGYHVRDCRDFLGLERNYLRFAIRCRAENEGLLQAMNELAVTCHVQ
jgi:histidinol-phosphate/aromatic aminotransferase/cobyric acid decarboxylase-like protein